MLTQNEARKRGMTIDRSAAGRPFAYTGSRFGNDCKGESVLTSLEAEMLLMLRQNAIHFARIKKASNVRDEAYMWAAAQEKKVRALIKKIKETRG